MQLRNGRIVVAAGRSVHLLMPDGTLRFSFDVDHPVDLASELQDGRLALGTWQSICLLDPNPDNPGRLVRLGFLAG